MVRVPVNPELLEWACERAGYTVDSFAEAHSTLRVDQWFEGERHPTLKQLESFANKTRAPIGYFFLPSPPNEPVPIPDFRTRRDQRVDRPSPDLLDTIYICQQRQDWYREYILTAHEPPVAFVGSASRSRSPESGAAEMRDALGLSVEKRQVLGTWQEALRRFVVQAEDLGVLVMVNGVVGSNNTRKLDPDEFRGFALSDPLAPLVFINGSDTLSAKMFTLAHELAHLWLGETALSDSTPRTVPTHEVEHWCNQVAAELLVPMDAFKGVYRQTDDLHAELQRLARLFKVSTIVILRRIHDAGLMPRQQFWAAYDAELVRLLSFSRSSSGGNFYHTTAARVSKRFARAIISSTLEGRGSYSEALRLLGFKKMAAFKDLGRAVGVDV